MHAHAERGNDQYDQRCYINRRQKKATRLSGFFFELERETRLELATPTLARSCSTN